MRPPFVDPLVAFDPRSLLAWPRWAPKLGPGALGVFRTLVRWGAHHSGLPSILFAALVLVLSWRVIKRSFRVALEVALALALLVAATRLGWLTW